MSQTFPDVQWFQEIPEFRPLQVLGQGGMGTVYKVRHLETGRLLALKRLHPHLTDPLSRARFAREFQITHEMSHPLFLEAYEFAENKNSSYYTMELVEGEHLNRFLARLRASMPWQGWMERLREVVESLLEGLDYLHQRGAIHRDLKPENILITHLGETRLLDLGLAGHSRNSRLTDPGTLVGTPYYMAPEQLTESGLDPRSDLYSLGVLLYEALSGRLPFGELDLIALLNHLLHHPIPSLVPHGPLPDGVQAWVMSLLAREPAQRPASAREALRLWRQLHRPSQPAEPAEEPICQLLQPQLTGRGALLEQVWQSLQSSPRVVCLLGEAGCGKSRVMDQLRRRLQGDGKVCHRIHPSGPGQRPFEPWARLLWKLLDKQLPPSLELFRQPLAGILPQLGPPPPGGDQLALFVAMTRVLRLKLPHGWLLLDGLDRFSEEDLDFLRFLLSQSGPLPGLLVSAEEGNWWSLGIEAQCFQVAPLEGDDFRQFCQALLGGEIEESLLACLARESRGNPLIAQELLKLLSEQKLLWRGQGRVWSSEQTYATLDQLLRQRIAFLDPLELELLYLISCARGRITFEGLLAATVEEPTRLLHALDQLVLRQLLREPLAGLYLMATHLRTFLEMNLPKESLRGWHTQLALASEREGETPERTAYHWLEAGHQSKARQYLESAARLHLQSRNHARARTLLEQLEGLEPLHPQLQEGLADACFWSGRPELALAYYQRLREPQNNTRLLRKMARCFWRLGLLDQAHQLLSGACQRILPSASLQRRLQCTGHFVLTLLGQTLPRQVWDEEQQRVEIALIRLLFHYRPSGWHLDVLALLLRQLQTWRSHLPLHYLAQREIVQGSCLILAPRAFFGKAQEHLQRGLDLALGMPSSGLRCGLLLDGCTQLLVVGHPHLERLLDATVLQVEQLGDPAASIQAHYLRGKFLRLCGRLSQSKQALERALAIAVETQNIFERERIQLQLQLVEALSGHPVELSSCPPRECGLHRQWQLVMAYSHWSRGETQQACRLARQSQGAERGDPLLRADQALLQLLCRPTCKRSLKVLQSAARSIFPAFACAALRLRANHLSEAAARESLRQALGQARRWGFLLEEGLAMADLALLERDSVRYQMALNQLQEAGALARLPQTPAFLLVST